MTASQVLDQSHQSTHSDFSQAQRTAGATAVSKLFFKVASPEDLPLSNCKVFMQAVTPAQTSVQIFKGSPSDFTVDHPAPRRYGVGSVSVAVAVAAVSVVVAVEQDASDLFQVGDTVILRDTSAFEFLTIDTVSVAGLNATLTFTTATVSAYSTDISCASCILEAEIKPEVLNYALTSASGTVDTVLNPIVPASIGAIDETWTVTWTSPTSYTVTGARTGLAGSGNILASLDVLNPDFSSKYFTIPVGLFSGTFALGDTLTFDTTSASVAFYSQYEVESAAPVFQDDTFTYCLFGE